MGIKRTGHSKKTQREAKARKRHSRKQKKRMKKKSDEREDRKAKNEIRQAVRAAQRKGRMSDWVKSMLGLGKLKENKDAAGR
jgi:hypothetical protein